MIMTRYYYVTFDLADYKQSPALRYQKIKYDLEHMSKFPEFEFLEDLKTEMEAEFKPEELVITENEEVMFHVNRLAKMMAVDMLVSGKADPCTMQNAVALPDEYFDQCIALTNEMALNLNVRVKEIEAKYKSSGNTVDNVL